MTVRHRLAVPLAVAATLLSFGSAFPVAKIAMRSYSPAHLALTRFMVASLIMAGIVRVTRTRLPDRADAGRMALCGFLLVTGYHVAFGVAQRLVTAGVGSIVANSGPIWTSLAAMVFLGERPPKALWVGMGISLCGVAVLMLNRSGGSAVSTGVVVMLAAAAIQGVGFALQRPVAAKYGSIATTAATIWAGTAALLILFHHGALDTIRHAAPGANGAVVFLSLASSTVGMLSWAYVLSRVPASQAAPLLLLTPVVATLIGTVMLGEVPGVATIAGGLLTLAGVALTQVYSGGHTRRRP